MADSMMIFGTSASVASIIQVLAKVVNTLRELHDRWKQADFTFVNFIAQLTALKAALNKLQEWMDADMDGPHHQLVMDLELSITCCRMLVSKMDFEVSELRQNENDALDMQSKMKLIVRNGTLEELQKMVERQTNALTLLLTVCNCKAISEQTKVLEKSSTRKVFRRVRDDTSSLYVQVDSASLQSRWTGNLSSFSKISKAFDFDRELFVSKVYERVIRSSLKPKSTLKLNEALEIQRPEQLYMRSSVEEKKRSQLIDRQLAEDSRILGRTANVLLLGNDDCGQTIVKQMKIVHMKGFTTEELSGYKIIVRETLWGILRSINLVVEQTDIEMDEIAKIHAQTLSRELRNGPDGDANISDVIVEAAQWLWASEQVKKLFNATEVYLPDLTPYFLDEIQRIAQKDYIPNESDILRARTKKSGIHEYNFTTGSLAIRMFDVGGQRSERKKWIHQFENVTSIIFSVDLSCYNQVILEDSNQNKLMESLVLFDSVVNSRWFMRTSVILLLCNAALFRQKMARDPLENYFPDYIGGNDVNKAAKYLLWRFNQVNRAHLNLYPHLCEATDSSNIRLVFAAIKESILQNALTALKDSIK